MTKSFSAESFGTGGGRAAVPSHNLDCAKNKWAQTAQRPPSHRRQRFPPASLSSPYPPLRVHFQNFRRTLRIRHYGKLRHFRYFRLDVPEVSLTIRQAPLTLRTLRSDGYQKITPLYRRVAHLPLSISDAIRVSQRIVTARIRFQPIICQESLTPTPKDHSRGDPSYDSYLR